MIRIGHIITSLNVGGAETMLHKLVTGTDPARFEHHVITLLPPGHYQASVEAHGVRVHSLGLQRMLPSLGSFLALRRLARQIRPDVWHGWMYHANLAAVLAAEPRTPVVWGIRHSLHRLADEKRLTRALITHGPKLAGRVARILYNSRASATQHERLGYPAAKTEVIPNGFDGEAFRPDPAARAAVRQELGLAEDTPLVGLVARLDPLKGHGDFLEAAARQDPATHFLLAGLGVEALRERVAGLGLEGRVHLLGPRADAPRLLAALDLFALTSLSEAFPNVLGEAMACGVPAVVTDVGDAAWILRDNGLVVPPGDVAALAAGWRELLARPAAERRELGRRARERILADFSLASVRHRYETMYHQVASKEASSCAE